MTIVAASIGKSMHILPALLVVLTLASCASYGGRGLRPGVSTETEVRQVMGEPAMQFTEADGSRELAYPRGPLGTQTFMVHSSRDGIVQAIEPVLNDATFNAIQPGLTKDEILRMIGPPRDTMKFPRLEHEAWDYKYIDTWGYPAIFSVTFDRDGRVVSKISQRLDRGDPRR
jgi:outer membrane protein assembly factor BamE (lipoprotein component of BamABCDE complex)